MRRWFLFFALFIAAAGRIAGFEQEKLSILAVENDTGYDIAALYLYPAGGDYSGPDLLTGGRFIPDGKEESFFLYFDNKNAADGEMGDETHTRFDLLAVDTEGYQYRITGLAASPGNPVAAAFTVRNHLPLSPRLDTVDIPVKNSTVPIFLVFLRPPESGWWGASVLGSEEMLISGQTLTLTVPSLGASVPYEMLAVDEDFDEYFLEVTVEPASASMRPNFRETSDPSEADDGQAPETGAEPVLIRLDDLWERQ